MVYTVGIPNIKILYKMHADMSADLATSVFRWQTKPRQLFFFFFTDLFFSFSLFLLLIFLQIFYPFRISFLFSQHYYFFRFLQFLANQTEFHSNFILILFLQFLDNQTLLQSNNFKSTQITLFLNTNLLFGFQSL